MWKCLGLLPDNLDLLFPWRNCACAQNKLSGFEVVADVCRSSDCSLSSLSGFAHRRCSVDSCRCDINSLMHNQYITRTASCTHTTPFAGSVKVWWRLTSLKKTYPCYVVVCSMSVDREEPYFMDKSSFFFFLHSFGATNFKKRNTSLYICYCPTKNQLTLAVVSL